MEPVNASGNDTDGFPRAVNNTDSDYHPPNINSINDTNSKVKKNKIKNKKKKKKRIRTVEGSCNQCLHQRVKCSLDKPICKRCLKEGLNCSYDKVSLKWGKVLNVNTMAGGTGQNVAQQNMCMLSGRNTKTLFTLVKSINDKKKKVVSVADSNSSNDNLRFDRKIPNTFKYVNGQLVAYKSTHDDDNNNNTNPNNNAASGDSTRLPNTSTSNELMVAGTKQYSQYELNSVPSFQSGKNAELSYFANILLSKLHAFGRPLHPRGFELLQHSKILQNMAGTLTACHIRNGNPRLLSVEDLQKRKAQSIQMLVDQIHEESARTVNCVTPPPTTDMESLLDACIMMSTLDGVIDCTNLDIVPTHLFGARSILNETLKYNPQFFVHLRDASPLTERVFSLFMTMDLIYCFLTCDCSTCISNNGWLALEGCDCWFGILKPNDPYLKVMSALSTLTNIEFISRDGSLQLDVKNILRDTFILLQRLSHPKNPTAWNIFVSGYADAGLLYYFRMISGLPIDSQPVQQIVNNFYQKLAQSEQMNGTDANTKHKLSLQMDDRYILDHCLLFPLMVVGAHCIQPDQQRVTRKWVEKAMPSLGFKNINILFEYLDRQWAIMRCLNDSDADEKKVNDVKNMDWRSQFKDIPRKSIVF